MTTQKKTKQQITPEEREMIDAAIAEGMVRVIPAGARTITAIGELVFDNRTNRLIATDKAKAQERLRYWSGFKVRTPK